MYPVVQAFRRRRTRQNELTPNQMNESVKQIARISRPWPVTVPACNLAYSRRPAITPKPAIARNVKPVTSSQSWCSTSTNDFTVAMTALKRAAPVRLRLTCWPRTLATVPSLRAVETVLTRSILTVFAGYNDATVRRGSIQRRRLWSAGRPRPARRATCRGDGGFSSGGEF